MKCPFRKKVVETHDEFTNADSRAYSIYTTEIFEECYRQECPNYIPLKSYDTLCTPVGCKACK
jgi:hypothetical protein